MSYPQQGQNKRSGLQPLHWALIGVGGVIVLLCGLCGIVGVFSSPDESSPSPTTVAATESSAVPAASPSTSSAEPSPTDLATTGAPVVGDGVIGSQPSADADVDVDQQTVPDVVPTTRAAAPRPTTQAPAPAPAKTTAGSSVYYKNCDAVRAAGADPIRAGDPGYAKHLDRDGDGVGCE
ncbi:excalibur calcium-binding domain-containing protein [Cryptosporangium aurantiacum]|uniref:Excalibur calcium-binding domain-containing protein n=1 Tax=Cryptosporangium aurantiacum TaxID=134849 RepID=A0A1M7GYM1_9ACTN|nr:excalibur calcium-binding domain-containing protein [Cryptosporangium aurantiacum]SHM20959.1 Excalibur calcium-binding domain-containing protein [Cryptosporangium aurantiacum]